MMNDIRRRTSRTSRAAQRPGSRVSRPRPQVARPRPARPSRPYAPGASVPVRPVLVRGASVPIRKLPHILATLHRPFAVRAADHAKKPAIPAPISISTHAESVRESLLATKQAALLFLILAALIGTYLLGVWLTKPSKPSAPAAPAVQTQPSAPAQQTQKSTETTGKSGVGPSHPGVYPKPPSGARNE